jgi:hypothetical protein
MATSDAANETIHVKKRASFGQNWTKLDKTRHLSISQPLNCQLLTATPTTICRSFVTKNQFNKVRVKTPSMRAHVSDNGKERNTA